MKYYLPDNENIFILGRTKVTVPLPLFWTASGVELKTDSSEVWFDLESDYAELEEWIRIEVDGFCMQRMIVPKGRTKICAFRKLPSDVVRTVRLMKEAQPAREDQDRYLLLHGIECDGTLDKTDTKKYRFEFIGDSLSSGEGLAGGNKLQQGGSAVYGLQDHYAVTTADYFQADFRILSQSGWGVHCSCYNDYICIMPPYYEQICGVLTGDKNKKLGAFEENDFSKWQPDVIIINLGSNDGFALDREAWIDSQGIAHRQITNPYGGVEEESAIRFEKSVVDFLKKLRKRNPKAYLLWAYGMCDYTMRPYLEKAITDYKVETNDTKVDFQILPATILLWQGSNNHPGSQEHQLASKVLIDRLKQELL